jgi:hypothetical protein
MKGNLCANPQCGRVLADDDPTGLCSEHRPTLKEYMEAVAPAKTEALAIVKKARLLESAFMDALALGIAVGDKTIQEDDSMAEAFRKAQRYIDKTWGGDWVRAWEYAGGSMTLAEFLKLAAAPCKSE